MCNKIDKSSIYSAWPLFSSRFSGLGHDGSTKYDKVLEICEKYVGPPFCDVIFAVVENVLKFVASIHQQNAFPD